MDRDREQHLPPLPVSRQDAKDLEILSRQGVERMKQLAGHLSAVKRKPLTVRQLQREVESVLAPDAAKAVANQLVRLGFACRRRQKSPEAVVEALSQGLKNAHSFDAEEEWKGVRDTVEKIISDPDFHVLVKSVDLSFDYSNLVDSLRIVVDMRPVMTEDREDIEACIVSHVLRVQYVNDEGRHSLSLLLDDDDIEALRAACDEAFHKAQTVHRFLTVNNKRTIRSGGEDNERG